MNIGGGPGFIVIGWLNLDEVKSSVNPKPFKFTQDCIFPFKKSSIKTVYTSHCLEHLEPKTANRVIEEVHRVLKDAGRLVIKIPDFDLILDAWRHNDSSFFTDALWGYEAVKDTWKNRNIKDCLDYRAAMLFCGFWNDEYGDHFSSKVLKNEFAYHGPPIVSIGFLRDLMDRNVPSYISSELRKIVIKNEKDYHFNHINSWGRKELENLLVLCGFRVISFDKTLILSECRDIPGIEQMEKQSMYCWACKA